MNQKLARRPFAVSDLHPEVRGQFSALTEALVWAYQTDRTQFRFEPYEGFRTADRQNYLLTEGTTKARGWQSAHRFGFAVDYVPRILRGIGDNARWQWHWPESEHDDWKVLAELAAEAGLRTPISWDKPHVEHPFWRDVRNSL